MRSGVVAEFDSLPISLWQRNCLGPAKMKTVYLVPMGHTIPMTPQEAADWPEYIKTHNVEVQFPDTQFLLVDRKQANRMLGIESEPSLPLDSREIPNPLRESSAAPGHG